MACQKAHRKAEVGVEDNHTKSKDSFCPLVSTIVLKGRNKYYTSSSLQDVFS